MTKETRIKLEILLALLLAMGIVALAPHYNRLLPKNDHLRLVAGNMVVYAFMAGCTLLRCKKLFPNLWNDLGYQKGHWGKQVLWGLAAGAFSLAVFVVLPMMILKNPTFLGSAPEPLNMVPLRIVFFMLFVGPVEELVFRGYLFRRVEALTEKPWTVCLVTSLLFGLWHFPVSFSLIQVVLTGAIGFVYGAFYMKAKNCSLLSLSIAHGIHDTGIMILGLFLL